MKDSGDRKQLDPDSDSDLYDTDDDEIESNNKPVLSDDEANSEPLSSDEDKEKDLSSDEEDVEDQHIVKKRKIVIEDDEE